MMSMRLYLEESHLANLIVACVLYSVWFLPTTRKWSNNHEPSTAVVGVVITKSMVKNQTKSTKKKKIIIHWTVCHAFNNNYAINNYTCFVVVTPLNSVLTWEDSYWNELLTETEKWGKYHLFFPKNLRVKFLVWSFYYGCIIFWCDLQTN